MKTRALHKLLIVLISGLIGYYIGVNQIAIEWKTYVPQISVISKEPPSNIAQTVDFSLFWDVWQRLEAGYYDKKALDSKKLFYGAISGLVSGLDDPYTIFLPPSQNQDFQQGLAGQFEGIGAELGMKDKQIIIVAPLDGSPAQNAGIRAGDAIVKVDNVSTFGWTLTQAVDKIRGPKGTTVTLAIMRKTDEPIQNLTIVRDTIHVKSVNGWVKQISDIDGIDKTQFQGLEQERVGYIRLSQFGDNTNTEWLAAVNKIDLARKQTPDIKGIILDLRNNPGGYLTDAIFVASEFLTDGTVVIQDKGNGDQTPYPISRKGLLTDLPVVVLINGGSASASEIVAGALHDHNRATLLGETSFGKGTIQEEEDLGGGAALHITVAKWLTPNGTWVHGKGITPDIQVSLDPKNQNHDTQLEKAIEKLVK